MLTTNRHRTLGPDLGRVAEAARYGLLNDNEVVPVIVCAGLLHTDTRCSNAADGDLEILTMADLKQTHPGSICGCDLRLAPTFADLIDDVKDVTPALRWLEWAQEVVKPLEESTVVDRDEPDLLAFGRVWAPVVARQLLTEADQVSWPSPLEPRVGELTRQLRALPATPAPADLAALAAQCHQRLLAQGHLATNADDLFEHDDPLQLELVHAAKDALASGDPAGHRTWVTVANPFEAPEAPGWLDPVRFGLLATAAPHESAVVTWGGFRTWWLRYTNDGSRPITMSEVAVVRVPTLVALVAAHMQVPLMALTTEPVDLATAKVALDVVSQHPGRSDDDNTVDLDRIVAATAAACAP